MAAENYHLKWDSHLSYLNNSVATLYKNEKFADVILYSSCGSVSGNTGAESGVMPTVAISAHKFILSSCSQFFATMFEASPVASPNGTLYVVLPPELSHRAIQILVQYMYSGEATVSNDILSEVLRGGELLKIRGLCRAATAAANAAAAAQATAPHYSIRSIAPPLSSAHCPSGTAQSSTSASTSSTCARYTMEQHHQHQQQLRGLGASVMPKDSPVIVKSPKKPAMNNKHALTGGISINKEVAIDPDEKCCYAASQQPQAPPLPEPIASNICAVVGCNSCSMESEQQLLLHRNASRRESREEQHMPHLQMLPEQRLERNHGHYQDACALVEHCERLEDELSEASELCEAAIYERRNSEHAHGGYYLPETYERSTSTSSTSKHFNASVNRLAPSSPAPPPVLSSSTAAQHSQQQHQTFVSIKQEPSDWTNTCASNMDSKSHHTTTSSASPPPQAPPPLSPKQPLDFKMPIASAVKIENTSTHSGDEDESNATHLPGGDYDTFTRLVCEICQSTFDEPKSWVRHLETHAPPTDEHSHRLQQHQPQMEETVTTLATVSETMLKSYVPKKRRRVSQQENSVDHVTLQCDICATSFETPAEWVRHMNGQHTEIEMAMYNSKKDNEQSKSQTNSSTGSQHKKTANRCSSLSYMEYAEKVCDVCNKKFSSNSSMLQHRRSHVSGNMNAAAATLTTAATSGRQQMIGILNRELHSATSPA